MEILKFIKFGDRKFMEELLYNGEIHLNTVEYFRKYEDENLRRDELEGVSYILRNQRMEIFAEGQKILYGNPESIMLRNENDIGNIYCLTSLFKDNLSTEYVGEFEVDPNLTKMGNTFVVIHNPTAFISLLVDKLNSLGLNHKFHVVKYEDRRTYEGEYGVFTKPMEYSYQLESRLFVKSEGKDPLNIEIGSLERYATIHSISELLKDDKNAHNIGYPQAGS